MFVPTAQVLNSFQSNQLFVNDRTGGFAERASGIAAGTKLNTRSAVVVDVNRDGWADLFVLHTWLLYACGGRALLPSAILRHALCVA